MLGAQTVPLLVKFHLQQGSWIDSLPNSPTDLKERCQKLQMHIISYQVSYHISLCTPFHALSMIWQTVWYDDHHTVQRWRTCRQLWSTSALVLSNGIEESDFYTQWYKCNVQQAAINRVYFVDVYFHSVQFVSMTGYATAHRGTSEAEPWEW